MKKPIVTVFTPVYNGLPYLHEAIESTLNQTYTDFNYLIIDDASPDPEVRECINSYNDPRIDFIINEENLGVSETFNRAMKLIDTPYVIRVDQDDVNLPNRIEDQLKFLQDNPDISVVCSWEHTIDENNKRGHDWKRGLKNYGEFLGPILLTLSPIWHPSLAFRREALIDIGGFKKEYKRAEDFDVTARFALQRHSAKIIPKFHLLQRQHSASQSKEFAREQLDMCYRIQEEVIQNFLNYDDSKEIAAFLRLENSSVNSKFTKPYLINMNRILEMLFSNIKEKQKLNSDELHSLKKIIFSRIGLGLRLLPTYKFLPPILFLPFFYILSPLFFYRFYKILSYIYDRFNLSRFRLK